MTKKMLQINDHRYYTEYSTPQMATKGYQTEEHSYYEHFHKHL